MSSEEICHKAIVTKVLPGSLLVMVVEQAECGGCSLVKFCGSGNVLEIEALRCPDSTYEVGEHVHVFALMKYHYSAVMMFFVIPIILLLAVIGICSALHFAEAFSALISLGGVGLWYGTMYLFRNRLTKQIEWRVR